MPTQQTTEVTGLAALEKAIAQHKGKVIYVDFWASWCAPCRKSFPWLYAMQQQYADNSFVILSVNLDAERPLAEQFLSEVQVNFPIIYDPKGETSKKYRLRGMPTSLLIDQYGNGVSSHTVFLEENIPLYEEEIKKLLGKS